MQLIFLDMLEYYCISNIEYVYRRLQFTFRRKTQKTPWKSRISPASIGFDILKIIMIRNDHAAFRRELIETLEKLPKIPHSNVDLWKFKIISQHWRNFLQGLVRSISDMSRGQIWYPYIWCCHRDNGTLPNASENPLGIGRFWPQKNARKNQSYTSYL